jgi:RNA polymerase sigma-70 factor (ECF subfamily)
MDIGEPSRSRRHASEATALRRRRTLQEDERVLADVARAVDRAKLGDREALGRLYLIYAGNIYGYVCSIVRDEHEAEDVTQQVFAKLMTTIQRYEQRSVPFSAWILRVAHNAAIDHVRMRRRLASEELDAAGDRPEDSRTDGRASLQTALAAIPLEQRRVVVMRHVVGLSPSEIAERLGKSENAVHGLHHRGRRALREQLSAMGSAPTTLAA